MANALCFLQRRAPGRPTHSGGRVYVQVEIGHCIMQHDDVGALAPDPDEDLVVVPHATRGHERPRQSLPQLARRLVYPPGERGTTHCHAEIYHEGLPGSSWL
ncbi:MAG: hypothetical protein RBG13Loki_3526 [Promethearchaeota archaeon CR_4]|nr:MAG: hypothetical protein RBG13Loki_3526 [Candidatus Lokiarchaeota archaeon CR_4]